MLLQGSLEVPAWRTDPLVARGDWRISRLGQPQSEEIILVAPFQSVEEFAASCRQAEGWLEEQGATILAQEIFGAPLDANVPEAASWPVTAVAAEGGGTRGGTTFWAVKGPTVERVRWNGRVVGSLFSDGDAQYLRVAGLETGDPGAPREVQARATFEAMESVLAQAGMAFPDVVRTWFYNDEILSWYRGFNEVRTAFFKERRVFDGLVPASTAIGGRNRSGLALTAGFLAFQPRHSSAQVSMLASPLQCPALQYGSSFSRAVELMTPGSRRILVSGTASIAPGGATEHVGEIDAQIDRTMRVVEAILKPRGAGLEDVVRGIVYVRRPEDGSAWRRWATTNEASGLPVVVTNNVVCRDDLLFEIEVDAVVSG